MSFNKRNRPVIFLFVVNLLVLLLIFGWLSGRPLKGATAAVQIGYGFNYQGALDLNGTPANGKYDMRFKLFDSASGGNMIGSPVTRTDVAMTEGRFSLVLDFGIDAFGPAARWLQIEVKEPNKTAFTSLSPRQLISPVPTALWSQAPWRTSGSSLYYTKGNVGIGETSPAWPLHVKAAQAVALLESTAADFGSVLELRNRTTASSRKLLGAINFNNAEGTYPGQIAYTTTDEMTFRVDGQEQLRLSDEGMNIPATSRFLAIPAAAFVPPQRSDTDWGITVRGLRNNCVGDGFACHVTSYVAPVNLPHGATITQLVLVAGDNATSDDVYLFDRNVELELYRTGWADLDSADLMASVSSTGSQPGLRYFFTEQINHAKVDNQYHTYTLQVQLYPNSAGVFRSAHITYQVTEPLP